MAYQGNFVIKNRNKYIGNADNIIYRSSWELRLMCYLDSNPSIKKWSSEEISIAYIHNGSQHRYYPDFYVEKSDGEKLLIEVKPKYQTLPPKTPKDARGKKRFLKESFVYSKNRAKWEAAEKFCQRNNMKFVIMTEDHLLHSSNK